MKAKHRSWIILRTQHDQNRRRRFLAADSTIILLKLLQNYVMIICRGIHLGHTFVVFTWLVNISARSRSTGSTLSSKKSNDLATGSPTFVWLCRIRFCRRCVRAFVIVEATFDFCRQSTESKVLSTKSNDRAYTSAITPRAFNHSALYINSDWWHLHYIKIPTNSLIIYYSI